MKRGKARKLRIESCRQCPSVYVSPVYTGDSFEYVEKWQCKKLGKVVRGPFDVDESTDKYIPDECPLPKY